ncbi:MAG: hypothetical protein ACYTG3_01705 [Planctomycetota bacterium]|jgi:hypothetical protein
MPTVGLNLGQAATATLQEALVAAGFPVVSESPEIVLVTASEGDPVDAEPLVGHVVEGGGLLVCGGTGPLLSALHLTPQGEPVTGEVRPCYAGLEPLDLDRAAPVTGVGFALYRIDDRCVALGGWRDRGVLAYVGDADPAPSLVIACLRWMVEMRSHSPGTR